MKRILAAHIECPPSDKPSNAIHTALVVLQRNRWWRYLSVTTTVHEDRSATIVIFRRPTLVERLTMFFKNPQQIREQQQQDARAKALHHEAEAEKHKALSDMYKARINRLAGSTTTLRHPAGATLPR